MSAVLAVMAALSFGLSDVTGAVATRRSSVGAAVLAIQIAGFPVLAVGILLTGGNWSLPVVTYGAFVGVFGTAGFLLYMKSMAVGPIGVISPLSAAVGAGVPVLWGVLVASERLGSLQGMGIVAGLIAVVLVAWSPGASLRAFGTAGPMIALVAGCLFGLSFVALDATPVDSGLLPLLVGRLFGTAMIAGFALYAARRTLGTGRSRTAVTAHLTTAWRGRTGTLVAVSGTGDALAIVLFLLATRTGLLSLASLLTSLYPVVALVIARYALKERLRPLQSWGVATALVAILALSV